MQNKSKLLCLVAASLVAGTAAASAQGYSWNSDPWYRGPAYETKQPRVEAPEIDGQIASILAAIEREKVPDRLLALAGELQAALTRKRRRDRG